MKKFVRALSTLLLLLSFIAIYLDSGTAFALSITGSLPDGQVGVSYSAHGLNTSETLWLREWTVAEGSLPDGLAINKNYGGIEGTPTKEGSYTFTLMVTGYLSLYGGDTSSVTRQFTITITQNPNLIDPTINGSFTSTGTRGTPYSSYIQAADGRSPYTWSYTGTLPPGLTLRGNTSDTTGNRYTLSGTPTTDGRYHFRVTVSDSIKRTATKSFDITIGNPAPASTDLTIISSLASGITGTSYSRFVRATGGTLPYTWTVTSGRLPEGLTLRVPSNLSNYCYIEGTPTSADKYSFSLKATDSLGNVGTRDFIITINAPASLTIHGDFPDGISGDYYSNYVRVTGGALPYTWSVISGDLPPDFKIRTLRSTGAFCYVEGTPKTSGEYNFTLKVADADGLYQTKALSITVNANISQDLTINGSLRTRCVIGAEYSSDITVTGGKAPYTWTIGSGNLPAGLTLSSSGNRAIVSGTPTTRGIFSFSLKATDSAGNSQTKATHITISDPVTLTLNYYLIGGTVGKTYSDFLSVMGGSSPYTWTISSGDLPPGLTLNSSSNRATVSGTPTSAGVYRFIINVSDVAGNSSLPTERSIVIEPVSSDLTINGRLNTSGTTGTTYSSEVTVTGGTAPYTWTISSGRLPVGLTLSSSGDRAVVSGTPTSADRYPFTLRVTDSSGNSKTQTLSIIINTSPAPSRDMVITPESLADGNKGSQYYDGDLSVTGGSGSYTWAVSSGTLPPGLRLYPSSLSSQCKIEGTPTTEGEYNFAIRVADSSGASQTKSFNMIINYGVPGVIPIDDDDPFNPNPLTINASLSSGTEEVQYSGYITVMGGTAPYTWEILWGDYIPGLTLSSSDNRLTFNGTPTRAKSYSLMVKVTDANGRFLAEGVSINILAAESLALTIDDSHLPSSGTVGDSYSGYMNVTGGNTPYTWTVNSRDLPPGVIFVGRSGISSYRISGTPTTAGTYSFMVNVADASGKRGSKAISIVIAPDELTINGTLSEGTTGTFYSKDVFVTGGKSPYWWSVISGDLPSGLQLGNANNRAVINGTPTTAGLYTFGLTVHDISNRITSKSFNIRIANPPTIPMNINGSFNEGTIGKSYSDYVGVTGGASPYTWTVSDGELPPGLTLNSSGVRAEISGTPTTAGDYDFTLQVTDSEGSVQTEDFTITIDEPDEPVAMTISGTLNNGTTGTSYTSTLTVSGGTAPYTWRVSRGSIPDGLIIRSDSSSNSVTISGTPSSANQYTFSLVVTDSAGNSSEAQFSITISAPAPNPGIDEEEHIHTNTLTITYSFSRGTVGTYYSDIIVATGGKGPYVWRRGGDIPAGLSLRSTNHELKDGADVSYVYLMGTPSKAGTYSLELEVTDDNGNTTTKSFRIIIGTSSGSANPSPSSDTPTAGNLQSLAQTYGGGKLTEYTLAHRIALERPDWLDDIPTEVKVSVGCDAGLGLLGLALLFMLRRSR